MRKRILDVYGFLYKNEINAHIYIKNKKVFYQKVLHFAEVRDIIHMINKESVFT